MALCLLLRACSQALDHGEEVKVVEVEKGASGSMSGYVAERMDGSLRFLLKPYDVVSRQENDFLKRQLALSIWAQFADMQGEPDHGHWRIREVKNKHLQPVIEYEPSAGRPCGKLRPEYRYFTDIYIQFLNSISIFNIYIQSWN